MFKKKKLHRNFVIIFSNASDISFISFASEGLNGVSHSQLWSAPLRLSLSSAAEIFPLYLSPGAHLWIPWSGLLLWASQSHPLGSRTFWYCALCPCERRSSSWLHFAFCCPSWVRVVYIDLCLSPCRCDLEASVPSTAQVTQFDLADSVWLSPTR